MNKYHQSVLWQHQIRLTGQVLSMQPEAITTGMQVASHGELWFCILPAYAGHHSGTGLGINYINQVLLRSLYARTGRGLLSVKRKDL